MDIVAGILLVSITLLIHYKIFEFCLLGIIIYHLFDNDLKTMLRSIIAFLLSVTIVVYIPNGVIEMIHPEAKKAGPVIIKEVQRWIS